MTDGLVTRIGRWIDHRWASKATQYEMAEGLALAEKRTQGVESVLLMEIRKLSERIDLLRTPEGAEKDIADLKTRMEKMELYAGMTRKVDPTKPPVVKSAFQM